MKRFVVFLFALVLCCSLLIVPASAAEFYDFVMDPTGDFYFDGADPSGDYFVTIYHSGDLISDEPFACELVFSLMEENHYLWNFTVKGNTYSAEVRTRVAGPDSYCLMLYTDFSFVDEQYTIRLTPVASAGPGDIGGSDVFGGLSDVVTADMLTGSMDHIVDLLPVVLVVIVAFIGIRKGISFLLQILHSA